MIESVLNRIKTSLLAKPYFDRAGGIVTPLKKITKSGEVLIFPTDFSVDSNGIIADFIPDNNLVGLCYFELDNEGVGSTEQGRAQLIADVTLACWVNMERLDPPNSAMLKSEIVETIPGNIHGLEDDSFTAASISYIGQSSIKQTFDRYTYNNSESKMFRYPFLGFGLKFRVRYFPKGCKTVLVVDNNDCFNRENLC